MTNNNLQISGINVDVQVQPDGKYDAWISTEGSSGAHYVNATAEKIGNNVADLIQCLAEALTQDQNTNWAHQQTSMKYGIALQNDGKDHEFTVGRNADFVVGADNNYVSRIHCKLFCKNSVILLMDVSSNGTIVDGKKLQKGEIAEIQNGSVIDLCGTKIEISARGWN